MSVTRVIFHGIVLLTVFFFVLQGDQNINLVSHREIDMMKRVLECKPPLDYVKYQINQRTQC